MAKVYFGLGSNIGNKEENIQTAVRLMEERIGELISLSALHITPPEGFISDNLFVNAVCIIETVLSPLQVLDHTEEIERDMGRRLKSVNGKYQDRLIDIDLLLYDNLIFESERLRIPHSRMTLREFVMRPLVEIAPTVNIPGFKKTAKVILEDLLNADK